MQRSLDLPRDLAAMTSKLGPFEVGQVLALHREGFSHRDIAERVTVVVMEWRVGRNLA